LPPVKEAAVALDAELCEAVVRGRAAARLAAARLEREAELDAGELADRPRRRKGAEERGRIGVQKSPFVGIPPL
jgi:hypothetical protein